MGIKVTTTITGTLIPGAGPKGGKAILDDVGRTFQQTIFGLDKELGAAAEKAYEKMGPILLDKTLPFVPRDLEDPIRGGGALEDSGRWEVEKGRSGKPTLRLKFGGSDFSVADTRNTRGKGWVDYALIVHENMDPVNWKKPGSGPKYLERGLEAARPELERIISDAIKKTTQGKK